ncbi:MAG: ribonuclease III [Acidobacteria bacterium]|nr:ribonuclease III [Acidobacteriota bacterium]
MSDQMAGPEERRRLCLRRLEKDLGHEIRPWDLLEQALTHRSFLVAGQARCAANETLEFLGDAVLGLVVADMALEQAPQATEGTLSRVRAALVNAEALAALARSLNLGPLLRLGEGEFRSGGHDKTTILAGACEALMGALFRVGGLAAARGLIEKQMGPRLKELLERLPAEEIDPKSALQERLQVRGAPPPEYRLAGSSGPDHRRRFRVQVWHGGRMLAEAAGESKKQAERRAARRALEEAGDETVPQK